MSGIAVFGGTFNPIHNGHLQMITEVNKLDFVNKILVMPDNIPPHKAVGFLADNIHRVNMCKIAVKGIKKAVVDESELRRGGKSYTFDTICFLKENYPKDDFFLVCGGDMVLTLDSWYKAEQLFKLCTFIVFSRNGISDVDFNKKIFQLREKGAKIFVIDADIVSVSSSEIREALIGGAKFCDLVPNEVAEYIIKNKVYN